jgi:hypothetical protein
LAITQLKLSNENMETFSSIHQQVCTQNLVSFYSLNLYKNPPLRFNRDKTHLLHFSEKTNELMVICQLATIGTTHPTIGIKHSIL